MEKQEEKSALRRTVFTPAKKMAVMRRYFVKREAVSALADEFKIAPSMIYQWANRLMENGEQAYEDKRRGESQTALESEKKVKEMQKRLARVERQ